MADPQTKVYWDACAWIGLINSEPKKIHPLRTIWEEAQKGQFEIWTSVYSYVEVFKVKIADGDERTPEDSDRIIEELLAQPYVRRTQIDVPISRLARDLRRTFSEDGLKSRPDAIHLATAAYWNL